MLCLFVQMMMAIVWRQLQREIQREATQFFRTHSLTFTIAYTTIMWNIFVSACNWFGTGIQMKATSNSSLEVNRQTISCSLLLLWMKSFRKSEVSREVLWSGGVRRRNFINRSLRWFSNGETLDELNNWLKSIFWVISTNSETFWTVERKSRICLNMFECSSLRKWTCSVD